MIQIRQITCMPIHMHIVKKTFEKVHILSHSPSVCLYIFSVWFFFLLLCSLFVRWIENEVMSTPVITRFWLQSHYIFITFNSFVCWWRGTTLFAAMMLAPGFSSAFHLIYMSVCLYAHWLWQESKNKMYENQIYDITTNANGNSDDRRIHITSHSFIQFAYEKSFVR